VNKNKKRITSDLLKGSGENTAEWFMVIQKNQQTEKSTLHPIDKVVTFFSEGDVKLSPRGSLEIGRIKMQRKGGDNGRPTANMLQFKINPAALLELK